ncbi:hypothetical protein BM523_15185 [Alteromonas mediterranea]|nr:hypothetical protein BM523_15185 [Alteromonas mediterranea]APD98872.1 hypothetical protein BM525_15260 [Alteromonas mediterranea]
MLFSWIDVCFLNGISAGFIAPFYAERLHLFSTTQPLSSLIFIRLLKRKSVDAKGFDYCLHLALKYEQIVLESHAKTGGVYTKV